MIVTDIDQCKILWDKYSPKQTLWEDWDIACVFSGEEEITPYFIVNEYGLLPLQKEVTAKGVKHYFFGNEYLENHVFWFAPEHFPKFFDEMPAKTKLFNLREESVENVIAANPEFTDYFQKDDLHYYIDLEAISHSMEKFMERFTSKHKKNLLYDLRKVSEYQSTWRGMEYFDKLVELNISRLGDDSDFVDEIFTNKVRVSCQRIADLGKLRMLVIKEDEEVVGAEIAVIHNDIWYVLNGGSKKEIKNLGKRLIMEHIQAAIDAKVKVVDFLSGPRGCWKELWNLDNEQTISFSQDKDFD
jgi:hypothetical protein